ncbi:GtrA family protein [Roseovarius sp. SYSU LYC5161]|uniref:GtrA family protein n=1 Tax=Roseovarius halophilus (ex Wu et al. 2025) TaxID=3376060 RepID=UPI003999F59E
MAGQQFARFTVVGGIGFAIDAGGLALFMTLGGDPYLMRLLSFALAVTATWLGNRHWTFRGHRPSGVLREYARYLGVQGTGAAVNYAVYACAVWLMSPGALNAVLALACGSAVALVVNYLAARRLVFGAPGPSRRARRAAQSGASM